MTIINKILNWLKINLVSVIAIIQGVIKFVKEVITAIVNLLFPLFPDNGKFETTVLKIRDIVGKIDSWFEVIKNKILAIVLPNITTKNS